MTVAGEVKLEAKLSDPPLTMDGSRVWVHFRDSQTQGWDLGIPGLAPILLSNIFLDRPCLDFTNDADSSRIKDRITGKDVFQLPGEYTEFTTMQLLVTALERWQFWTSLRWSHSRNPYYATNSSYQCILIYCTLALPGPTPIKLNTYCHDFHQFSTFFTFFF